MSPYYFIVFVESHFSYGQLETSWSGAFGHCPHGIRTNASKRFSKLSLRQKSAPKYGVRCRLHDALGCFDFFDGRLQGGGSSLQSLHAAQIAFHVGDRFSHRREVECGGPSGLSLNAEHGKTQQHVNNVLNTRDLMFVARIRPLRKWFWTQNSVPNQDTAPCWPTP